MISSAQRPGDPTSTLISNTFLLSLIVATTRAYGPPQLTQQATGGGWDFDIWGKELRDKENALRLERTLAYLTKYAVSDPATLEPLLQSGSGLFGIATNNSPQYQAALWIAQVDNYRISIPAAGVGARALEEERRFTQRYSLAVFFFATGGVDFWLWKMKFLSGRHECGWHDKFRVDRVRTEVSFGVICDGTPDFAEGAEDEWNGIRTVTGISLPRKCCA